MKELFEALRYYCENLAVYDDQINFVIKRTDQLIAEKGFTPMQAALSAATEDPGVAREPEIEFKLLPNHYLETLALVISVDRNIDPFDALAVARKQHPRLTVLADILERSYPVFREACIRAGHRLNDGDYTDRELIELIILKADEVTRESANKGFPEESTLAPGEPMPIKAAK